MKKNFYVARVYVYTLATIVEVFDNKTDAETYASLMCRTKKEDYIVLEKISGWLKPLEED